MKVVALYIVFALCFVIHGIEANLSLSLSTSSSIDRYKTLIQQIRQAAMSDNKLYGIPILEHSVQNSQRYGHIDVINKKKEKITLAFDVVNLRVVAYRARNNSYFFSNTPEKAFQLVFPTTHQNILDFSNTFQSIEKAAGITRLQTPLGVDPLQSAISNLFQFHRNLVPESLLVVIQMFIEASKFKFIEQNFINSMRDLNSFTANLAIVSLEDNWSELSAQIQASKSVQGVFGNAITLYNFNGEPIEVNSIYYPIVMANIALQEYHCDVDNAKLPNLIRMPGDDALSNGVACNIQATTTRISGREGFCADAENGYDDDGNPIILYPCGRQVNQIWTFQSDGTIRFLGKCLTTNSSSFKNLPVIYNCDKANQDDIIWEVSITGTILNPSSNLVLTANAAKSRTHLTVEPNTYAASQAWRVGEYVNPIVTSIIGLQEMCLEATDGNTNMWLEDCVKSKPEQYWALYSDLTIRVNNRRSLCVTSPDKSTSQDPITITSCNGSANQRWVFLADGTILNPETSKRMDVSGNAISRKKIILYPENHSANQQWVAFY